MVRFLVLVPAVVVLFFCAAELQAAQPEKKGPTTIKLQMGSKTLVFSHQKHQTLTNNQCWECHDKSVGKIDNWGEATAHKLCIPCHDLNEKGPISCKSCHNKK
jgi:predicted CXXCH cytochrome family protein